MELCDRCFTEEGNLIKLRKCGHFLCRKCLCSHLQLFTSAKIICPVESCSKLISDADIRMCLSNNQIKLYNAFCHGPTTVKCLITNCPYLVSSTEGEGHFTCCICGQPNCLSCGRLHDVNLHCKSIQSYDQNPMEIETSVILLERKRTEFEKLMKELQIIPNPESFECVICFSFILPRVGYILRNCLHCFCKDCFCSTVRSSLFIKNMVCPNSNCDKALDSSEIISIIGEDTFSTMMIKESASQFFQCKNGDCIGRWDLTVNKGFLKCTICDKVNCIECNDIHDGVTCEEFRRSAQYMDVVNMLKSLNKHEKVTCFACKNIIIKNGGCGSVNCSSCGNNTCSFTGKLAGIHNPEKCYCQGAPGCTNVSLYCQCRSSKPCHSKCVYGCYPENK